MICMSLKDKTIIKRIVESYLIAFALMNVCGKETTDIFTLLFFGLAFLMLGKRAKAEFKRDTWLSVLVSCLFTLFYVMGTWQTLTGGLTNKLFLVFYFGCTIAGLFCLFYEVVLFILVNSTKVVLFEEKKAFPVKGFFIASGILFLCMLPFLLINFPAVMTPDSLSQYRQTIGTQHYSDHHPWAHTMVFALFYKIGFAITGDTYLAIAFYTVVQMVLVALCIAYVWAALYEMGLKKGYCMAGILLFVICPYNLVYSVTIWKDILFSMAILLLCVTLFRLYEQVKDGQKGSVRDWILYGISALAMCMLRHNGLYGFLAAVVILFILFWNKIRNLLWITIGILCVCFLIKGPVMSAMDVTPGQFVFKLCIPLQQVCRVVALELPMEEEEIALVSQIGDISYVMENYEGGCADYMTAWVEAGNQDYLIAHKGEYLKLWIALGLRYPGEYVQAFIDQTKGYWYPMAPQQTVFWGITQHETGLVSQAVLEGPVILKICEILTKLYTIFPLYGILYSMGAMFWILVLCGTVAIRNKRYSVVGMCQPVFWVTVTLFLATPLVADLRYNYPLMVTIPCILAAVFYGRNKA